MLEVIDAGDKIKETIIFLYDFKSNNDFILEDLMTIKRDH